MTRRAVGVLFDMVDRGFTGYALAVTINELIGQGGNSAKIPRDSLYYTLSTLVDHGYVSYGPRAGHADTYYVNKKGMELYNTMTNDLED